MSGKPKYVPDDDDGGGGDDDDANEEVTSNGNGKVDEEKLVPYMGEVDDAPKKADVPGTRVYMLCRCSILNI